MADDDRAELALRFQAKEELRRRLSAIRRAIPEDARRARSAALAARVMDLDEWKRAGTVLLYAALKSEARVDGLQTAAYAAGKVVALTRLEPDDTLSVRRVPVGAPLEATDFGFKHPLADADRLERVDLVVVPGHAFDERGHRLGWGKGHYDRLLPRLEGAVRVGVGYDFQLMAELPDTPNDARLDLVVTDQRVIRIAGLAEGA
jgi:5-formyltetrahydrofolate cyclo-ligase